MQIEPYEWNVVLLGNWNRAILTPNGIAKRLFKLEEGTALKVEVPIDGLEPPKVIHDNCAVQVSGSRLIINTRVANTEQLETARNTGINALVSLPETPMTAVGFNLRYKVNDPPPELYAQMECPLDTAISDAGFVIIEGMVKRSIEYNNGLINIEILSPTTDHFTVLINYHLESRIIEDLKTWLRVDKVDIQTEAKKLMEDVLGLTAEEELYVK